MNLRVFSQPYWARKRLAFFKFLGGNTNTKKKNPPREYFWEKYQQTQGDYRGRNKRYIFAQLNKVSFPVHIFMLQIFFLHFSSLYLTFRFLNPLLASYNGTIVFFFYLKKRVIINGVYDQTWILFFVGFKSRKILNWIFSFCTKMLFHGF